MGLAFSENVRQARSLLGITQEELKDLLGISASALREWEHSIVDPHPCWDRIIHLMLESPSFAQSFLSQKPWLYDRRAVGERISSLLKRLNWSKDDLSTFLAIYPTTIKKWQRGHAIGPCFQIVISLLELYADIDQKDWPAALYAEEKDVITPERVRSLRKSLAMTLSVFGSLFHIPSNTISNWEHGNWAPRWCGNLLLRMVEAFPRSVQLLEMVPWDDTVLTPDKAIQVRNALGLSQLDLARLLQVQVNRIWSYENEGFKGADCVTLVYGLLEHHPEEFIGYLEGLASSGG